MRCRGVVLSNLFGQKGAELKITERMMIYQGRTAGSRVVEAPKNGESALWCLVCSQILPPGTVISALGAVGIARIGNALCIPLDVYLHDQDEGERRMLNPNKHRGVNEITESPNSGRSNTRQAIDFSPSTTLLHLEEAICSVYFFRIIPTLPPTAIMSITFSLCSSCSLSTQLHHFHFFSRNSVPRSITVFAIWIKTLDMLHHDEQNRDMRALSAWLLVSILLAKKAVISLLPPKMEP